VVGIGGRAAILASVVLAFVGCGGGGGGRENKFVGDTLQAAQAGFAAAATGKETLVLEQTTLAATFPSGASFPLTLRGKTDPLYRSAMFVRIGSDREQVFRGIDFSHVADTTYDLNLRTSASILPGTYTGTMQIIVCGDPACSKPYANSPINVSYSFEVTPPNKFSAVPATIIQSQAAGESSETSVTLIPSQAIGGRPLYFRMGGAPAIVPDSGSFVMEGSSILAKFKFSATLAPGRHESSIGFIVCYDLGCSMPVSGSPVQVPYSLTVTP